jgi:hypothetical protein
MILFVIRKLFSISHGFKLDEVRIKKRMAEEGVYELRILPVGARATAEHNMIRDVILPYLDRQIAAAERKQPYINETDRHREDIGAGLPLKKQDLPSNG